MSPPQSLAGPAQSLVKGVFFPIRGSLLSPTQPQLYQNCTLPAQGSPARAEGMAASPGWIASPALGFSGRC